MTHWKMFTKGVVLFASLIIFILPRAVVAAADNSDTADTHGNLADIMFVIDNSGSMKKNDPDFITKQVVADFTDALPKMAWVGIVLFDTDARITLPLAQISQPEFAGRFQQGIDAVNYRGQFTNMPDGVAKAIYELKKRGRKNARQTIIFLTDGIVDTGNKIRDQEKAAWLREELANESKKAGIQIISIAFTDKADIQIIQSLAIKTGGEYFIAATADEIPNIFSKINVGLLMPSSEEVAVSAEPESEPEPVAAEAAQISPEAAGLTSVTHDAPSSVTAVPDQSAEAYHLPESIAGKSKSTVILLVSLVVFCGMILYLLLYINRKVSSPARTGKRNVSLSPEEEELPEAFLIDEENLLSMDSPSFQIKKKRTTIGRDTKNDIVITKETISGTHAIIEYKDGYFHLTDNRSTNTTKVNNHRIEDGEIRRLKSGDAVSFADYRLRFEIVSQSVDETVIMLEDEARAEVDDMDDTIGSYNDEKLFKAHIAEDIKRISDRGPHYRDFAETYLDAEVIDRLAGKAKNLMPLSQKDKEARAYTWSKRPVFYQLCILPGRKDNAIYWFKQRYHGFTRFLVTLLDSEKFEDCGILCVITYGRVQRSAWSSITIVQRERSGQSIETMSVEFLTDEERHTLGLDGDQESVRKE